MSSQSNYTAAWYDLRWRRIMFWAVFISYIPGVAFINFAMGPSLSALTGVKPDNVVLTIALCWMIAFAIAGLRLSLFRCPRCGRSFFSTSLYTNSFARKCVHCGLPNWAGADEPNSN
jgi:hypothetical protein